MWPNILCKLILYREFLGIVEKSPKNVHSFTEQSQNVFHCSTVLFYSWIWCGGVGCGWQWSISMVFDSLSFETSFDSKQPKLEPKLVSALSETKRLFRLFCFYTETESFDVSIEPKETGDQPKQFYRVHILLFFYRKCKFLRFFFDFSVFFLGFFLVFSYFSVFSVCFETVCFGCFASIPKQRVSIEPKQTEDPPKQFKREYICKFFQKLRVVSVCFGLLRNRSICFGCFDIGSKHRNKAKFFFLVSRNKPKQTRNRSCFGLFRFEPKFIFVCF